MPCPHKIFLRRQNLCTYISSNSNWIGWYGGQHTVIGEADWPVLWYILLAQAQFLSTINPKKYFSLPFYPWSEVNLALLSSLKLFLGEWNLSYATDKIRTVFREAPIVQTDWSSLGLLCVEYRLKYLRFPARFWTRSFSSAVIPALSDRELWTLVLEWRFCSSCSAMACVWRAPWSLNVSKIIRDVIDSRRLLTVVLLRIVPFEFLYFGGW